MLHSLEHVFEVVIDKIIFGFQPLFIHILNFLVIGEINKTIEEFGNTIISLNTVEYDEGRILFLESIQVVRE
jgi:hypothetical protein